MNELVNPCRGYREQLCLLAASVLSNEECPAVERHLEACAGCRKFYAELQSVAVPLSNWEKSIAHVQPGEAARARWAEDFKLADRDDRRPVFAPGIGLANWCRELLRPHRWIWLGFAATWLVIAVVQYSSRTPPLSASSRPAPELVRVFIGSEGLLAQSPRPSRSKKSL